MNSVNLAGFEIRNMKQGDDFPYLRKYTGRMKLDESSKVIVDVLKTHKKLHNPFLIQFYKDECLILEAEVNQKLRSSKIKTMTITDIRKKINSLSYSYRDSIHNNRPYHAQEEMSFMNPYIFDKNRVYYMETFIGDEKKANICDKKVVSVEEHEKLIEQKTVCVMSDKFIHHSKYNTFLINWNLKEVKHDDQGKIDYLICGAEIDEKKIIALQYENIISDIWLLDCLSEKAIIIPPRWYHHFYPRNRIVSKILQNENIVATNYNENERIFIQNLVNTLGGNYSNSYSPLNFPILLAEASHGRKCEAAIKSNLPILKVEWLIKCYTNQLRCDENEYLVGGKESQLNKGRRMSIIPGSFDIEEQENSSENLDTELTDFFKDLGISLSPTSLKKLELVKWKNEFSDNLLKGLSEEDKNKN